MDAFCSHIILAEFIQSIFFSSFNRMGPLTHITKLFLFPMYETLPIVSILNAGIARGVVVD